MSNLMAPYFQSFLTPLFNIGHDLGNMIDFEKKLLLLHIIKNNKVHHGLHIF